MLSIKEMVAGGKKAQFVEYRQKELWYRTEDGFEFPVPIDDAGDGRFQAEEKAMLLMRYIRKHVEMIQFQKEIDQIVQSQDIESTNKLPEGQSYLIPDNLSQEELGAFVNDIIAKAK